MKRANQIIVGCLGIIAGYMLYIGVFGDPTVYPNYGEYLLYGIVISIIIVVSYLIIESKRAFSKDWPIDEIQKSQKDA